MAFANLFVIKYKNHLDHLGTSQEHNRSSRNMLIIECISDQDQTAEAEIEQDSSLLPCCSVGLQEVATLMGSYCYEFSSHLELFIHRTLLK